MILFFEGTDIWGRSCFRLGLRVRSSEQEFLGQIASFERRRQGEATTRLTLTHSFCTSTSTLVNAE